jgi:hypothetical protein
MLNCRHDKDVVNPAERSEASTPCPGVPSLQNVTRSMYSASLSHWMQVPRKGRRQRKYVSSAEAKCAESWWPFADCASQA